MTPEELVHALADTGRSVSIRTLKDWRRRGLLPPLTARSRGRGKGVERLWLSPTIFDRAAVAHDLLDRLEIADEALFHLAGAGYLVEAETLRKAWISRLDRQARFLAAAGRRRKDGVDGLLDAVPPAHAVSKIPNNGELTGFLQLLWELHRVYVAGETIDEDELYGLVDDAVRSLGFTSLEGDDIDVAEKLVELCQVFFHREFERRMVEEADPNSLLACQIAVNRCYRSASELLGKATAPMQLTPELILIQTLGMGSPLLKTCLYVCDVASNDMALVGFKRIEQWANSAEYETLRDGELIAMPTLRTRANLFRIVRDIFNA